MNQQPTPPDRGDRGPVQDGQGSIDRSSFEGVGARASERIQLIIEAAEQAAAGIIDDAEAQARRYLEESQARADRIAAERATKMWSLTDDLIGRAEAVKRQSDDLLRALDDVRQGMEEALRLEPGSGTLEPRHGFQPEPQPEPKRRWPREVAEPRAEPAPPPEHDVAPRREPDAEPRREPEVEPRREPEVEPRAEPGAEPRRESSRPAAVNPPSEGARLLATQMAVAGSNRAEIESRLRNEFGIRDTGPMLDSILGPDR